MMVVIAILLTTLASIIAAGQIKRRLDDAAADNTGRYLMQIRGAVVDLQVKYEAWLNNVDTSGTRPEPIPCRPISTGSAWRMRRLPVEASLIW
ncbi:hypothetical protein CAL14_10915 [Bordetella genomosp. 9]|uniref:hypothetical protein n=1 Tax=Bordetella genomosp. 9 TaxID=1416803 RepID=UPI000A296B0B|nr:hypothetical protein [Bordetella genomosp. 9]ARP90739.1 hypothetical protein CAL14_10915 [Bordetella genomosp. 9]